MLQRLITFIREIARRQRSGFVKGDTIVEAINSASSALWRAKVDEFRRGGDDILLQPFRSFATLDSSGQGYTITGGAEYEVIGIKSTDASDPDIIVVPNESQFAVLRASEDYDHIMDSEFSATINAISSGKFDLPDDTFDVGVVFYHEYNGNRFEGQVLEDREFLDRRNSVIIPSSNENPIARVVNDQIEFHPIPTGGDTLTFTVPYRKHNPIARYYKSSNDLTFRFDPVGFNSEVEIYFYKIPDLAAATFAFSNGIETPTVTTEVNWSESAFPELALRALAFIGIAINNEIVLQAESLMEQNNQVDAND